MYLLRVSRIRMNNPQGRGVAPPLGALLFCPPQKSKQKKVPELLALRVPSIPLHFAAKKKTRFQLKHFSSNSCKVPFHSGCVIRELVVQKQNPPAQHSLNIMPIRAFLIITSGHGSLLLFQNRGRRQRSASLV